MGACMSVDECSQGIAGPKLKNQIVAEFLSAEANASKLLCRLPRRIWAIGTTPSSCAFSTQGRKGINQDCMLVWEGFAGRADTVFCGVFDGHGPNGHLVARKVRDSLPSLLNWPADCEPESLWDDDVEAGQVDKITRESDLFGMWKEKMLAACKRMDLNLQAHPKLNCLCSGTTAVTMVIQDKDLIIGNVGDSRAILARQTKDGSLTVDQLTVDSKPDVPGELERIIACQGRVFALQDEPLVARVWQPHSDTPGLAMARALGDFSLKNYGLSAIPQVSHRRLTQDDEFIVLATDGVWDVMSNEDVITIVSSASPKEDAAKCLVGIAVKAWKHKRPSMRMDDCTVICHFLKDRLTPSFTSPCKDNARVKACHRGIMKDNEKCENRHFALRPCLSTDMLLYNKVTKATLVSHDNTLVTEKGVDHLNGD